MQRFYILLQVFMKTFLSRCSGLVLVRESHLHSHTAEAITLLRNVNLLLTKYTAVSLSLGICIRHHSYDAAGPLKYLLVA